MVVHSDSLPISAVIIVRDAEQTIGKTLESLRWFDEVIVYDNGSTDRTLEIIGSFPNVSLHEGEFLGFGPTKNHAAGLARHDWVLLVDSDESVSDELFTSIAAAALSDSKTAYSVLRANYFRGKHVRHSGWGADWLVRLYHRGGTQVSDISVHEVVLPPSGGRVVRLRGELSHDAVRELSEFLVKIDRYSEIRRNGDWSIRSPAMAFLSSFWAFVRSYILKLGFLDGWRGLEIAVCDANGVFFKYMKPYVDRHE